jgi:hypothetical protein
MALKHMKRGLFDGARSEVHYSAYLDMTPSERKDLDEVFNIMRRNLSYHQISAFIHEATHALGDRTEIGPFREQVKAYNECYED